MLHHRLSYDPTGTAHWGASYSTNILKPSDDLTVHVQISDAQAEQVRLRLGPDGVAALREGLLLAAMLAPPSHLRTQSDDEPEAGYEIIVDDEPGIAVRFMNGRDTALARFTKQEIEDFAGGISHAETRGNAALKILRHTGPADNQNSKVSD